MFTKNIGTKRDRPWSPGRCVKLFSVWIQGKAIYLKTIVVNYIELE